MVREQNSGAQGLSRLVPVFRTLAPVLEIAMQEEPEKAVPDHNDSRSLSKQQDKGKTTSQSVEGQDSPKPATEHA